MVGERLAEIRKDHDDTQAVLAKKLNVSVTTVRSWEQEKSSPSHDALVAICRLYRISADYLLGLSEVDPAYDPRGNQQRFTEDEWAALREYTAGCSPSTFVFFAYSATFRITSLYR